ncbi:MAG: DMT family transporter [Bilophila sp.]
MNNLARLRERQEVRFAKKGLALALFSGMIWSLDGLALGKGLAERPFDAPALWLFAPLLAAGLHDFFAACLCLAVNCAQGRGREIVRTLFSKPGRLCILGALLGSPLGMGGFLMGLSLAGPAYVLPITSLYPAIAALLALVFLKERISRQRVDRPYPLRGRGRRHRLYAAGIRRGRRVLPRHRLCLPRRLRLGRGRRLRHLGHGLHRARRCPEHLSESFQACSTP